MKTSSRRSTISLEDFTAAKQLIREHGHVGARISVVETTAPVAHPHDPTRLGVFVPWEVSPAYYPGHPVPPDDTHVVISGDGIGTTVDGEGRGHRNKVFAEMTEYLSRHEFDVRRPHEAIWLPERLGYGVFYLPTGGDHGDD